VDNALLKAVSALSTCIPVGLASKINVFAFSVSVNEAILRNDQVQIFWRLLVTFCCYGNQKPLATALACLKQR